MDQSNAPVDKTLTVAPRLLTAQAATFLARVPGISDERRRIAVGALIGALSGYDCCSWVNYYSGVWSDDLASAREILQTYENMPDPNPDVIAVLREAVAFFEGGVDALGEVQSSACSA